MDDMRAVGVDVVSAPARLLPLLPEQPCNGYWHGHPGLDQVEANAALAKEVALDTR